MKSELCKTCIHTKVCMKDKNLFGDIFVMGNPDFFDNDDLYAKFKEREKAGFPCEDYLSADVVEVVRKPIIGYEGYYEVDQFGRVNSINRMVRVNDNGRIYDKPLIGKQMKQSLHTKGYKTVSLTKDGDTKTLYVHRIVAEAFIPNPNNFPCVNHIDEDKTNNFVENLEWCSEQYNTTYGKARIKQAKALRGRELADCHKQKISDGVKRYYHSKGERKDG